MKELIGKAAVLIEALPYIQKFRNSIMVVKFGGSAMEDPELVRSTMRDVVLLEAIGIRPIVVHGGGKAISAELRRQDIPVRFVNGLRYTCEKTIKNASYPIRKLADSINSEGTLAPVKASFAGKIESGIVNGLFYKFQVKASGFHVTDKCTRCRKCEEVCPLNNISFLDNRPVWGNECTHCMACICRCPAEAIEYKKASLGRRRYTNNKEVTL